MPISRAAAQASSDLITVVHQFANQGIDLAQTEGGLRPTLKIATHETIFVHAHLQGSGTSFIDGRGAVVLGQREHAQDAVHALCALLALYKEADCADMGPRAAGSAEQ